MCRKLGEPRAWQEGATRDTGKVDGSRMAERGLHIQADGGNMGDLQSEDNQGCQHCSLHQPNGVIATTERKASGREEGMEIQSTLLEVDSFIVTPLLTHHTEKPVNTVRRFPRVEGMED